MTNSFNILIIDDEEVMRDSLSQVFSRRGHSVRLADSGRAGLKLLSGEAFDLVVLDLKMPGIPGMEVLRRIRKLYPETVVIIITGHGTMASAVEAMKAGAYDFLPKPFTPDELTSILDRALEKRKLAGELARLRDGAGTDEAEVIIGPNKALYRIYQLIWKVAPTDSNVLITGESGTGKELVARAVHRNSPRKNGPFVTVDCGSLVPTLFESELFGHVRGAFTDAVASRCGKLELADGGTIFFDEIANINMECQARLLRAIQEREITRVGDNRVIKFDARLIAATNKDLRQAMKAGEFREDLFYRLNVVNVHMPPLRERKEDIPALVKHFIAKYNRKRKKNTAEISDLALELLTNYRWPGNIRELENIIERAVILCEDRCILPDDLPLHDFAPDPVAPHPEPKRLEDAEKEHIASVLKMFAGRRNRAAEFLDIDRKTLRAKIRKYGLE